MGKAYGHLFDEKGPVLGDLPHPVRPVTCDRTDHQSDIAITISSIPDLLPDFREVRRRQAEPSAKLRFHRAVSASQVVQQQTDPRFERRSITAFRLTAVAYGKSDL